MYQDQQGNWYDDQGNPAQDPSQQQGQQAAPVAQQQAAAPAGGFAPTPPGLTMGTPPPGTTPGPASWTGGAYPSPPPQTFTGINPFPTIQPFDGGAYPGFTPPPLPASLQQQFKLPTADELVQNDPGYEARFKLGQQSVQRSAAANGSILNPGTLQALNQKAQDYASGEYNNYVQQKLGERGQQANDYLTLAYGPAWMQNQSAVNQYGQLYRQYTDLIGNNRNASQDYINALLAQERIGVGAAGSGGSSAPSGNNV